jgi:hypothetical protein
MEHLKIECSNDHCSCSDTGYDSVDEALNDGAYVMINDKIYCEECSEEKEYEELENTFNKIVELPEIKKKAEELQTLFNNAVREHNIDYGSSEYERYSNEIHSILKEDGFHGNSLIAYLLSE